MWRTLASMRAAQLIEAIPPHLLPARPALGAAPFSTATDWLDRFTNHEQKGVPVAAGTDSQAGFNLGRMYRLLQALSDPQAACPAVHVAGTKGKGSTVVMLGAVLRAAGYSVGTYTSPHVTSLHERIALNGLPISPPSLQRLIASHAPLMELHQQQEGGALTHFEVLTALAFKHFQEEGAQVVVVETGLGGVRDATNVLPAEGLAAAVVTAVDADHVEALGGSMESIAAAKAGIFKRHRPAVIARQPSTAAREVLLAQAEALSCELHVAEQEVSWRPGPVAWTAVGAGLGLRQRSQARLHGATAAAFSNAQTAADGDQPGGDNSKGAGLTVDVSLKMLGGHQLDNAAAAIAAAACLKRQGFAKITLPAVVQGLEEATLPGRFQLCRLQTRESATGEPLEAPFVVLDGAHTADSAAALVDTIEAAFPGTPVAVVLAMAADKPHREVCAALRRLHPAAAIFTEVAVAGGRQRSAPPGVLAAAWQAAAMLPGAVRPKGGQRTRELIQASLSAAVDKARVELGTRGGGGGLVVVTGSLHAVGAALRQLDLHPAP